MAAPTALQPFRFETTYDTADVERERPTRGRATPLLTADRVFIALGIVGVLLLFWIYTIALGAVILALTTFAWGMREKARPMQRRTTAAFQPPETVRVGGNESEYWIEGQGFSAHARWDRVRSSSEWGEYIRLHSMRMPAVFLPIAALKEAGAYENVKAILEERQRVFRETMGIPLRPAT